MATASIQLGVINIFNVPCRYFKNLWHFTRANIQYQTYNVKIFVAHIRDPDSEIQLAI